MSGEAELARQLESAQDRIEELESEQERVSAEFEGECTKELCRLLKDLDYEWDGDGVTPDQGFQFIRDTLTESDSSIAYWEKRARKAEHDLETLRAGIRVLKQGDNE